eukprot:g7279.t1
MTSLASSVHIEAFGTMKSKDDVKKIIIKSSSSELALTNYGATLISFKFPDKNGVKEEVTLCYQTFDGIRRGTTFYGATVGRYGNRIAKGKFELNGETYTLATNNGENHLHGGNVGFDKVLWNVEEICNGVKFTHTSKDGEEGYPGTMEIAVLYKLVNGNQLSFEYEATVTDKETPINVCNHTYWNLSGDFKSKILNHVLEMNCEKYLPVDDTQIPTGEIRNLKNTDMEFPIGKALTIGSRINNVDGGGEPGYDHCYVVSKDADDGIEEHDNLKLYHVATVYDATSGRRMKVHSSEPGVQLYTGNFLSKNEDTDTPHVQHNAFCLETQHFPNSINEPTFPSVILSPGKTFRSKTLHTFDIVNN